VDGASVTQVAQRHEVTRQQIYAWRHDRNQPVVTAVAGP
jgi:transposase-like protein